MIGCLIHRGPDNLGSWTDGVAAFGHSRLSIIDRSAAGNQPMQDASGRYQIVFNGEVYNYRELRPELEREGHRFVSQTDTEVVLHAYMQWGAAALNRFNGMWAFAVWDTQRQELFAARDRAGKKPLYYLRDPHGNFVFASEIKAFLKLGFRFAANPQAAFDFLVQGTYGHLGRSGFLTGVEQLEAGHWLRVSPESPIQIERYWDLPVVRERDRLPYDAAVRAQFRALMIDAVRIRLRADVPVGATLSGGLDSSLVVGIVDQITNGAPIHLFTSQYTGTRYDESRYFDAVVSRLSQPIVHSTQLCADDSQSELTRVICHQEEPFGDTSILAHHLLMREARQAGVPVILSGQGGDELLMGYPSLVNAYLGHLIAHGRWGAATHEMRCWSTNSGRRFLQVLRAAAPHALPLRQLDWARSFAVGRLAKQVSPRLAQAAAYRRFEDVGSRSSLDSYVAQVFKRFSIPHLTHYDDRNAMAYSVEGRMPFLDYRLVELLSSVRYDALFNDGVTKRILRESFADLIPQVVLDRRDKIGFYTPLPKWLRDHRQWVDAMLTQERMAYLGVLNADWYRPRIAALWDGDDRHAADIWRAFAYHLWAEIFEVAAL